jgi:glycyl-tRNA synthetase (class II)
MEDDTVTLRDRDSLDQSRISISELAEELKRRLGEQWTSPKLGAAA